MEAVKEILIALKEELAKKNDEVRQLPTVEARKAFAVRLVKKKLKTILPTLTPKGKSRSEDRLFLHQKRALSRAKAKRTAKMRYSPNRSSGELVCRISHRKYFSWRLLARGLNATLRKHHVFFRTSSRSRRSPVRSAAKGGGDDGGGDGDPDGPADPPRSSYQGRIIPSAPVQARLTPFFYKLNSSTPSRTPHPCSWCMDWRCPE